MPKPCEPNVATRRLRLASRSAAVALILAAVAAVPATAQVTTYHLTSMDPTNSVDGYGVTYVGAHNPLTFDFTLAAPLGANLPNTNILAQVLSYRASGGTAQSTITNLDYVGSYKQIELSTNAQGAIVGFHFHVVGQNLALPSPTVFLDFNFTGANGALTAEDLLFYRADAQFHYGEVNCANANCGTFPGFAVTQAGGVPEPASWAMMIVGLGAVGGAMRYRVRAAKTASA